MGTIQQGNKDVIVVCGGLNWDIISQAYRLPTRGETCDAFVPFKMQPGGKGANTAIALHRLSHFKPRDGQEELAPRNFYEHSGADEIQVRMIGAIGEKGQDDGWGQKMLQNLQRHYVEIEHVPEQDMTSGIASIWVEADTGDNRILVDPGANHALKKEFFQRVESFGSVRPALVVAQLELDWETVTELLQTARNAEIDTLLNPSPAQYLDDKVYKNLTHLILNQSEADIMSELDLDRADIKNDDWNAVTDQFLAFGVKNVVITLGERGAFCSNEQGKGRLIKAEKVEEVTDASGAGDTFVGAYAVRWVIGKRDGHWDIFSTVQYACRAAARTIKQTGCQGSIPWADELDGSYSSCHHSDVPNSGQTRDSHGSLIRAQMAQQS